MLPPKERRDVRWGEKRALNIGQGVGDVAVSDVTLRY